MGNDQIGYTIVAVIVLVGAMYAISYYWKESSPTAPDDFTHLPVGTGTQHQSHFDPIPRRKAVLAAIKNQWTITMVYRDTDGVETVRKVEPWEDRGPVFKGFCHLRQEERTFRYERIVSLEVQAIRPSARDRYRVRPAA